MLHLFKLKKVVQSDKTTSTSIRGGRETGRVQAESGCDPSQKDNSVFYKSRYFMTFLVSLRSQNGVGLVKLGLTLLTSL